MPAISAVRSTQTRFLSSTPTLRQGSRGATVSQLQQKLKAKGFNVTVDGDFGPKTTAAVRAFQQSRGLGADGVVGPNTWAKVNAANPAPPAVSPGTGRSSRPVIRSAQVPHSSQTGTLSRKIVCPGLESIVSVPPCASTSFRASGKPSPVPFSRVVKNGSKMRACSSLAMPGPSSFTS